MNEKPRPEQARPDPSGDEPQQVVVLPAQEVEPESEGGEAPCWAHLLDDDGKLE